MWEVRKYLSILRQVKLFTPQNSWITTSDKIWLSKDDSVEVWKQELEGLVKTGKVKKTIFLGNFCKVDKVILLSSEKLEWPTFYTTKHSLEWSDFRYKFWKLING